jgi:hypothetical protein
LTASKTPGPTKRQGDSVEVPPVLWKKPKKGPQRPSSAYAFFAKERALRPLASKERATTTLAVWKELSDEEKRPFEEQAQKDNYRFLMEISNLAITAGAGAEGRQQLLQLSISSFQCLKLPLREPTDMKV